MTDTTTSTPTPPPPEAGQEDPTQAPEAARRSAGQAMRALAEGDLGSLRVVLGIALVWIIFQSQNSNFLTATNLTNLILQVTAVGTISIGVVLVLLLGEIDLSVGSVSGLCSAIVAVLSVKHGWNPVLAMVAGLLAGMAIGLFQGGMITTFALPSFAVTLAGLIGWQGLQLKVLGETGTINLPDNSITKLTSTFFSDPVGWAIGIAAAVAYLLAELRKRQRRSKAKLPIEDMLPFVARAVLVCGAILVSVAIVNSDRGVPLAAVILVGFVAAFAFVTTRTAFGRELFATGGNAEAARRAGIKIKRVRITVFAIASIMAAFGGILAESRLLAVNQSSGGSDLLLLSIAGPVVAGVSLFGGRGSVWAALLGAILIGSISNGMDLLGLSSPVKFMITGAVLLLAVTLDSVTRLRRQRTGRA